MNPQQQIASLVKQRGYWDGLQPEQLICRHVAKLVEELAETADEIYDTTFPDAYPDWLFAQWRAGKMARAEFDDIRLWPTYKILCKKALAAELADLQVVIFSMAEVMGIDVVGLALEKAQADVERGVR